MKKIRLDLSLNCKSEISNVCNVLKGYCLRSVKLVHHHADDLSCELMQGKILSCIAASFGLFSVVLLSFLVHEGKTVDSFNHSK